jgi:thiol:disulfide interchange protein
MESFKQAMSFLLFATAAYLLWVYGGLIDLENLLGPMFGLSAIAIAAWIHGRWNLPGRSRRTRWLRGMPRAIVSGRALICRSFGPRLRARDTQRELPAALRQWRMISWWRSLMIISSPQRWVRGRC